MVAVNNIDLSVWRWMVEHRSGAATSFFTAVTALCNPLTVVLVTAIVGVALLAVRRELTVRLVGCVAGAWVTATVVKLVVGRSRPPAADRLIVVAEYSFPSGHATQSIALWTSLAVISVVLATPQSRSLVRAAAGAAAFVVAVSVGVSRLYLGVHWLTDVVAGWIVGSAWCWAAWRGVDRLRRCRSDASTASIDTEQVSDR